MLNYRISYNELSRKKDVIRAINKFEAIRIFCKRHKLKKIDEELLDCQVISNEEYEEEKSWK